MKFSYNWLKELSGTKKSPQELAELLTMHSFEVESVEQLGAELKGVVVGRVEELHPHPDADRLQVVIVDVGPEKNKIVCGAFNMKENDKVPVALPGTVLPNGIKVEKAVIRGVESDGMLCAQDELGLGDDHSGIAILDKKAPVGKDLSEMFGAKDWVLSIDILPNRAHDCLSHWGVARDICALEGKKFTEDGKKRSLQKASGKNLEVNVKDAKLCPRYIGVVLESMKIGSSPPWLKARLAACGMRSINNVVDITNYVMLETGQPLHAFDQRLIKNGKIIIRPARREEKLKLLDESEINLEESDLLIAGEEEALALAGIMGGEKSGIADDTNAVVLEAANFNSTAIRKSRTRLRLNTESGYRFERALDPNLCEIAAARAVELLGELAGARVAEVVDEYPFPVKSWLLNLDTLYTQKLLGVAIKKSAQTKILESLGFDIKELAAPKESWISVTVPTQRIDVTTQEDLIEEIGRVYGYEKIPTQPMHGEVAPASVNEERIFDRKVKDVLAGLGIDEMYSYSFYGNEIIENAGLSAISHWEVENPINPDQRFLRINLLPQLLRSAGDNLKHFDDVAIFEIGRNYWENSGKPEEKKMVAGVVTRNNATSDKQGKEMFYYLKGLVDELAAALGIEDVYYDSYEPTPKDTMLGFWHPGRAAEIRSRDYEIGFIGEINPLVCDNFGIKKRVVAFEIDFDKLKNIARADREYAPLRRFPLATRDISMLVGRDILIDQILRLIQGAGGELVIDADLFDIFEEIPDEPEKKSVAFHVRFGADDRTLESGEVDELMKKIITDVENKLGAKVRTG